MNDTKSEKSNANWLFMLLAVAGIACTVWFMMYQADKGLKGTQIVPPRPLSDLVLVDVANEALPAALLKNKWSYVLFADSQCDENCEQQLQVTQKVVATVDSGTQRLLVMGYEPEIELVERISSAHPDLIIAVLTRPIWAIFTVQFKSAVDEIGGNPFFLVNPRGMVIAGYDELVGAEDVADDLHLSIQQF